MGGAGVFLFGLIKRVESMRIPDSDNINP